jgi:hypothetical protein
LASARRGQEVRIMRQTQILRTHKRRAAAQAALVEIPSSPVSDTSEAAALLESIDAVLDTAGAA